MVITVEQIHEAMQTNKDILLSVISEMVQTKSITRNEYEIGQVFVKWLREFGFEAKIVEMEERHPNVFGDWVGTEGPRFIYNGHMDTLPVPNPELWDFPPFSGHMENGYIHGRGTGDMKGANAVFLVAMKILKDLGFIPKGSVQMVYTCDEQIGGARGAKFLVHNGYIKGEYGLNGEPTEMQLLLKHKGVQQYIVTVKGKSYAASFSGKDKFLQQTGIDALEKAHKAMSALYELRDAVLKQRVDPDLGCSVLGITSLHAGDAIGLIAGEAKFTVDRRFNPGETFESVTKEIVTVLERLKAEDPEFDYECENTASSPVFDIPEDHPVVKAIHEAYQEVRGIPINTIAVPWGTDATTFAHYSGVVMPVIGPGLMDLTHNEKVPLENLFDLVEIYALTVAKLLG